MQQETKSDLLVINMDSLRKLVKLLFILPITIPSFLIISFLISKGLDGLTNGDILTSIIMFGLLGLIFLYLIIFIQVIRFLTRIILTIVLTSILFILLSLFHYSIGQIEYETQLLNIETVIYLLVIGFILLFIYIFVVESVKYERIIRTVLYLSAVFAIVAISVILIFLAYEGLPIFDVIGIGEFLLGIDWFPAALLEENKSFGAFPLIWGTVIVAIGAIVISVPLSICAAIFISEIAPPAVREVVKPAIELLAGIPSIIYGFFGVVIVVSFLQEPIPGYFMLSSGASAFTGSLILAIMALPTITSVAEDAINSVPEDYKEASLAVGATNWQTISRVTVPAAISGITAAIILGMGRAIGETMAVMMVMGNSAIVSFNLLESMRAITSTLAIEMGEVAVGSEHYHALFGLALVLLIITLFINSMSVIIIDRFKISNKTTKKREEKSVLSLAIENNKRKLIISGFVIIGVVSGIFLAATIGLVLTILLYIIIIISYYGKKKVYDKLPASNKQIVAYSIVFVMVGIVVLILFIIIGYIVINGIPYISLDFILKSGTEGIFPAIYGTFLLVIGAITFALPIGICAAIFLVEYQTEGRATKIIRAGFDLLNGTPSIVYGLFGFTFFVLALGWGLSLIACQVTLGLMILPTVLRTTEESLKAVPESVREGSLALGATKWQTIRKVVLPPALPGIVTGSILGIGRSAGETAPILFTGAVFLQPNLPESLFDTVMALPYLLYGLLEFPTSEKMRYGTALVLLIIVCGLYLIAIIIRNVSRRRIRW
ncbi:MAG: phosphate ABC transporter permease subunit PstC [Promethearchaeota archaeon]